MCSRGSEAVCKEIERGKILRKSEQNPRFSTVFSVVFIPFCKEFSPLSSDVDGGRGGKSEFQNQTPELDFVQIFYVWLPGSLVGRLVFFDFSCFSLQD